MENAALYILIPLVIYVWVEKKPLPKIKKKRGRWMVSFWQTERPKI